MLIDIDSSTDTYTYGDGSWDPWPGGRSCCPGTGGSRLYASKEAMRQMLTATGDIEFALMKYAQEYAADIENGWTDDTDEIPLKDYIKYMNNQNVAGDDTMRYRSWDLNGACYPPFANYGDTLDYQWLSVPFATDGSDNRNEILMWMNHHEFTLTGTGEAATSTLSDDGLEQELRAAGATPLAGAMLAAEQYLEEVYAEDFGSDPLSDQAREAECRPYSVILLTDGEETCGGNVDTASTALHYLEDTGSSAKEVRIYVIGLNTALGPLQTIAENGNTGAPLSANSQVELAQNLYDIVDASLLVETCDGVDNDCDGLVDEGFVLYCNTDGAGDACGLTGGNDHPTADMCERVSECACDGIDNNCDGEIDEPPDGLDTWPIEDENRDACGGCEGCADRSEGRCEPGDLVCEPGTGMVCVGSIGPRDETCNGLDDDCDGDTDEDIVGETCGACGDGNWYCIGGEMICCGADSTGTVCEPVRSPEVEECNGEDDDCDGTTDEDVVRSCGGCTDSSCLSPSEGVCERGEEICTNGVWGSCEGAVGPGDEVCNGLDDDCDGLTDEDLVGETCGSCGDGNWYCVDGVEQCCSEVDLDGNCVDVRTPISETCNNVDDDCDGATDNNVPPIECMDDGYLQYAGIGICNVGYQICENGAYGNINPSSGMFEAGYCRGQQLPKTETCNGVDDDCDGDTDEDIVGEDGCGLCGDGTEECIDGILQCTGARTPSVEECNNIDDDCDTLTDENLSRTCMDPDYASLNGIGICHSGIEQCKAGQWGYGETMDVWVAGVCGNEQLPQEETCDCLDNDCDGDIDEDLGAPVGEACNACGVWECRNCELVCTGFGEPEICDGLDNNCNGLTDEGDDLQAPCGGCVDDESTANIDASLLEDCLAAQAADSNIGPGEGECQVGIRLCDPEADDLLGDCQGHIAPIAERCDAKDNDCDGLTDEEEDIEQVNEVCATAIGRCEDAWWRCADDGNDGRSLQCCVDLDDEGKCITPTGPEVEVCNAIDDDCDGLTDEEIPGTGQQCGSDLGVCRPGAIECVCEGGDCELICVGATEGSEEECNGLDDDCNGLIDEDIPLGAECTNAPGGVPTGECDMGHEQCINGKFVCNANEPTDEICDGLDNDCDGLTDEELAVECPEGSYCVEGECASPCRGEELSCPAGLKCLKTTDNNGAEVRVCQTDVCRSGSENVLPCVENPYWCDEGQEPVCKCNQSQKKCINICADIPCPEGRACVPKTGHCETIDETCYASGCPDGEICKAGECQDDPCADKNCKDGEYCNGEGKCVAACTDQDCPVLCFEGKCVDRCEAVDCDGSEVCNPVTGECEERGACDDVSCKFYQVCRAGKCVEDPCFSIVCPNGYVCENGGCSLYGSEGPIVNPTDTDSEDTDSGEVSSDSDEKDTGAGRQNYGMDRVLATGAGGCLCNSVPGAPVHRGSLFFAFLGGLLLVIRFASRRRVRSVLGIGGLLVAAMLVLGCQTDPFQLDLGEGTEHPSDNIETSSETESVADTESESDDTKACDTEAADDECDGIDNDCDGETDEGVDLKKNANHCGECGNDCTAQYANAFGACEDGECKQDGCLAFYQDLNGDTDDGCEYFCQKKAQTDGCNGVDLGDYEGIDDDCDGETDEDVDLQNDKFNCGKCGNVCLVPHAEAICEEGVCKYKQCDDNFYDVDSRPENGCEYTCLPTDDAETCNAVDDNCDGETDEGNPGGGAPCYLLSNGCTTDANNDIVCKGRCKPGEMRCVAGHLQCEGQVTPLPVETCNNIDDNCDGRTDEGLSQACTGPGLDYQQVGVCRFGIQRCVAGQWGECLSEVAPSDEVCDGIDNDCDGETDEDPVNVGQPCGGSPNSTDPNEGACAQGMTVCVDADVVCEGEVTPTQETCDGVDNDCDGFTDENLTLVCGGCDPDAFDYCESRTQGLCQPGVQICSSGQYGDCVASIGPKPEVCDGLDNDCDGTTDVDADGNPIVGVACGTCGGFEHCLNHQTVCCLRLDGNGNCVPPQPPTGEVCDNIDNDCDGLTDNDLVERLCDGDDADLCAEGVMVCAGGVESCSDNTGDNVEVCDGLDNDCDGVTDEDVSEAPVGWCRDACGDALLSAPCNGAAGWTCQYDCSSGPTDTDGVQCNTSGQVVNAETWCNLKDDDCDGLTDENLTGSVENCGQCGNNCWDLVGANAHVAGVVCVGSGPGAVCRVDQCDAGYHDLDAREDVLDCEYGACVPDEAEETTCDGADNDCDGTVDEGLATMEICDGADNDCDGNTDEDMPPPDLCNPQCPASGTNEAVCYGANGWRCRYDCIETDGSGNYVSGTVDCEDGSENLIADTERFCDGLDNNCDGTTDEGFRLWDSVDSSVGARCTTAGIGACSQRGFVKCADDGRSLVCCSTNNAGAYCTGTEIPENPTPGTEGNTPDGVDDDCDGYTDDGAEGCVDYVTVTGPNGTYDIFSYEASRIDATADAAGQARSVPCATDGVLPWTNVSFLEARQACLMLNDLPGTCSLAAPDSDPASCWDLCGASQWYYGCAYASGVKERYPYGDGYVGGTCNGVDYTGSGLIPAGDAAACIADWDDSGADDVWDLSGNAQEWTLGTIGTLRTMRGGSYKDIEDGLTCDYNFWGGAETGFQMEQIGFRCCRNASPITECDLAIDHIKNHEFDFGSGTVCTTDGFVLKGDFRAGVATTTGTPDQADGCIIGTNLAGAYSGSAAGRQRNSAVSPVMDLSACEDAGNHITITFDLSLDVDSGDTLRMLVSDDGGDTWYRMRTFTADAIAWTTYTQNVNVSRVSDAFRIRFIFDSLNANGSNARGAYIDNINISRYTDSGTPSSGTLDTDVADDVSGDDDLCATTLNATIRDFTPDGPNAHPDFEMPAFSSLSSYNICSGIVQNTLSQVSNTNGVLVYGNPALNVGSACATSLTSNDPDAFDEWYTDNTYAFPLTLNLQDPDNDNIYTYENNDFFPINGLGYGNYENNRNYHFTTEINSYFVFDPPQSFAFTGDDDVWVFINGQLVVDVGGIHAVRYGRVTLNANGDATVEHNTNDENGASGIDTTATVDLNLVPGYVYTLDVFHAERHVTASNFRIDTNLCFQDVQ